MDVAPCRLYSPWELPWAQELEELQYFSLTTAAKSEGIGKNCNSGFIKGIIKPPHTWSYVNWDCKVFPQLPCWTQHRMWLQPTLQKCHQDLVPIQPFIPEKQEECSSRSQQGTRSCLYLASTSEAIIKPNFFYFLSSTCGSNFGSHEMTNLKLLTPC